MTVLIANSVPAPVSAQSTEFVGTLTFRGRSYRQVTTSDLGAKTGMFRGLELSIDPSLPAAMVSEQKIYRGIAY